MKLFIFPITENDLSGVTELFSVIPLLSESHYQKVLTAANSWNEGLYARLRFLEPKFEYVKQLNECDLAIIPFKYNKDDSRIISYCNQARESNKQVVCFFNDDSSEVFYLPNNLLLFRTSLTSTEKLINERSLPVIIPDHFPSHINLPDIPENKIVTFCGHVGNDRLQKIERFKSIYFDTNIVYRSGFWAPEFASKQQARINFYKNLLSGSFTLCMRGNGNFSYRFYEALCFGRIPVFINTDCVMPFSNIIDWNDHIISVNEDQIELLPEMINNSNISPLANRKLWQTFFSAEGYYNKFVQDI